MTTFNIGDQVRYVGARPYMFGKLGFVVGHSESFGSEYVQVDFGGTKSKWGARPDDLELVASEVPVTSVAAAIVALEKDLRDARADYAAMVDVKLTAQRNVEAADLRIVRISNALIALKNL